MHGGLYGKLHGSHSISCRSNSQIFLENRDFCLLHVHSTPPLGGLRRTIAMTNGMEKLEWCDYSMVRNFEDMFICFDRVHERAVQTDRQTDTARRHKSRLCIASRGKN